jgi:predicted nuclease of predicted toxin-antitoxin system
MRILFDNCTPRGVASALPGHTVEEARSQGWDTLRNGELLDAAEAAGFDVFLTTDRNIRYQQNLVGRKIAIVVLDKGPMEAHQEQASGDCRGRGFSDARQLRRDRDFG